MTPPLAQTMIVCDAVHRDPSTGKFFLMGTFSTIFTRQMPCRHRRLCLFLALTECRGKTPIRVALVRVDPTGGADQVITQTTAEVDSPDPLAVHELIMQIKEITFPEPGEYRFQLESAGELLLEKRLVVVYQPGSTSQAG
jgi:hypothetical protein